MVASGAQLITDDEHQDLIDAAVHVEHGDGDSEPDLGGDGYTHTIRRKIHVPVEQEVKVPVTKKTVETNVERKVINGVRMKAVTKFHEVTETVLETKEEVVEGFRERWVKVKEPSHETVKKQVPITRTRRVSYIDYVEKPVEKVVEVPQDVVRETHGVRVDKHVGTKVIEVEEDHHYEMRPIYVKKGETRVRETGAYIHHGKAEHGPSHYEDGDVQWEDGRSKSSRSFENVEGEGEWLNQKRSVFSRSTANDTNMQTGYYSKVVLGRPAVNDTNMQTGYYSKAVRGRSSWDNSDGQWMQHTGDDYMLRAVRGSCSGCDCGGSSKAIRSGHNGGEEDSRWVATTRRFRNALPPWSEDGEWTYMPRTKRNARSVSPRPQRLSVDGEVQCTSCPRPRGTRGSTRGSVQGCARGSVRGSVRCSIRSVSPRTPVTTKRWLI